MRLTERAGRKLMGGAAIALIVGSAGCSSNKLETGYAYTPLGSTPQQRRGYYAGAYSPDARPAGSQQPGNGPADAPSTPRHRN